MELYISTLGTNVSREKESFCIVNDEERYILSANKIESIVFETESRVSIGALKLALEKDIPITISCGDGKVLGQFYKINDSKSGKLRKAQYKYFQEECGIELGKNWILEKMNKQKAHLELLLKRRKKELKPIFILNSYINKLKGIRGHSEEIKEKIRGIEGIASKVYYSEISKLLDEKWKFKTREHQKATTPYNITLNYLYGILYRKVKSIILANGFDSTIGIIHVEGKEKLPLLYDFIEKYRYLGFESVFEILNKDMLKEKDFEENILSIEGRRIISKFLNEKLKEIKVFKNKRYSVEKLIEMDLKDVKKLILEE